MACFSEVLSLLMSHWAIKEETWVSSFLMWETLRAVAVGSGCTWGVNHTEWLFWRWGLWLSERVASGMGCEEQGMPCSVWQRAGWGAPLHPGWVGRSWLGDRQLALGTQDLTVLIQCSAAWKIRMCLCEPKKGFRKVINPNRKYTHC